MVSECAPTLQLPPTLPSLAGWPAGLRKTEALELLLEFPALEAIQTSHVLS